jgi:hypothetical protein
MLLFPEWPMAIPVGFLLVSYSERFHLGNIKLVSVKIFFNLLELMLSGEVKA